MSIAEKFEIIADEVYNAGYEKGKAEGKDIQVELTANELEMGGLHPTNNGSEYDSTNRARTDLIFCTTKYPVSITCNSSVKWLVHFYNNDTWLYKSDFTSDSCEDVTQLYSNPENVTHIKILFAYANEKEISDLADLLSHFSITKWTVAKTYEDGVKAEYDRFWDSAQANGIRTNYNYGFAGSGWTDKTFNPKYSFSNMKYAEGLFYYANITNLDIDIDASNLVAASGNMFAQSKIKTIKSFKFSSNLSLPYAFRYAYDLENITIVGEIPFSTRFNDCPLTHDSLMNIINALKSGVTQTLTLGADNLAKLTDAEKAIATEKGWTLA